MEAACSGDVEVCQLLLEARAAATQSETITALGFAESEGHREAKELNDKALELPRWWSYCCGTWTPRLYST